MNLASSPSKASIDIAENPPGLHSFGSVAIHAIATYNQNANLSGTFKRAPSFPAPVHTKYLWDATTPVEEWSPLPLPTSGHLELHLGERFGEGTCGVSYAATVKSSTSPGMPRRICVKWGKGQHCRTLAREAWFYEQLHSAGNCEGVITPRCYGFFTMHYEDMMKHISGLKKDSDSDTESDEEFDSDGRIVFKPWKNLLTDVESFLPDDSADGSLRLEPNFCDDADLKADSSWAVWHQKSGGKTLVSFLLLEELGACYPHHLLDEDALSDIREIATDLGYTGIQHYDLRSVNVLRKLKPPKPEDDGHLALREYSFDNEGQPEVYIDEEASENGDGYCERHQKVHGWRLIDFDRATKTIFQDEHPEEQRACLEQGELVGNEYFLGTLNPWIFPYIY